MNFVVWPDSADKRDMYRSVHTVNNLMHNATCIFVQIQPLSLVLLAVLGNSCVLEVHSMLTDVQHYYLCPYMYVHFW